MFLWRRNVRGWPVGEPGGALFFCSGHDGKLFGDGFVK